MVIQVLIRLILYIDQVKLKFFSRHQSLKNFFISLTKAITRKEGDNKKNHGIDNTVSRMF